MLNKDNIDQKIFFNLTNKYDELYKKGEITEEQLNQVLELIENYEKYKPEKFQKKIKEIFDNKAKNSPDKSQEND